MGPHNYGENDTPQRLVMRGLAQLTGINTDGSIEFAPINMGNVLEITQMVIACNPVSSGTALDAIAYADTRSPDMVIARFGDGGGRYTYQIHGVWVMAGQKILVDFFDAPAASLVGVVIYGLQYDLVSPGPDNDKFFATEPGPQGVKRIGTETVPDADDTHYDAPITPSEVDDRDPLPLDVGGPDDPDSTYR